jgi:NADH:ubiquinone oxidoreductase subunit 5 (subunit L)/multisubunit Na+/H+ antiporter MnhA subunit
VGAITALFMGLLGIVQNDIKKVVAYSTLSQLGYMTVALGVSAYSVAIFHLMTHAFFKALLFLGAGSVIVAMHHEKGESVLKSALGLPLNLVAKHGGALVLIFPWQKVVAYSTLSQLGYMTVALGVSAYSVAIFHLMTHAFNPVSIRQAGKMHGFNNHIF